MVIFKNAADISSFLNNLKKSNKVVGFVPTMGALHHGHISLVQTCKNQNDITVCSIFVNPTQFNNQDDFDNYPVTIEKDIELLIEAKCDILFLPPVTEIYPPDHNPKTYSLGKIETILEGYYRPGHFQGVCQVMDRLLEIIQPRNFYMGQKDYQQCMIIQQLLKLLGKENEYNLFIEPTVREEDGLAMSSRNLRLNEEDRGKAPAIFHALNYIKDNLGIQPIKTLKNIARRELENNGFTIDYVEIADAYTLESVSGNSQKLVAVVAATINNIRLIDNMVLN